MLKPLIQVGEGWTNLGQATPRTDGQSQYDIYRLDDPTLPVYTSLNQCAMTTTKPPHQNYSQLTKYTTKKNFDPHGKGKQCIHVSSYTYAKWEITPKSCCKTEFPKHTHKKWQYVSQFQFHTSVCLVMTGGASTLGYIFYQKLR